MTETLSYIKEALKDSYPPEELHSFTRLIMRHVCGLDLPQLLMGKDTELSDVERRKVGTIVERLKKREPIQYILGETDFYGLPFTVTPAVLIPRPETEELVDLIVKENRGRKRRILDIGTGSGCIAVSLARNLPGSEVSAVDISGETLQVARRNAERNGVSVAFSQADILSETFLPGEPFDIIASNPPYVMESEKASMDDNVLLHEPPEALFVPDHNPLVFYEAIARFAGRFLEEGGELYLEINTSRGDETVELMRRHGFREIRLMQDLSGKDRFITGMR